MCTTPSLEVARGVAGQGIAMIYFRFQVLHYQTKFQGNYTIPGSPRHHSLAEFYGLAEKQTVRTSSPGSRWTIRAARHIIVEFPWATVHGTIEPYSTGYHIKVRGEKGPEHPIQRFKPEDKVVVEIGYRLELFSGYNTGRPWTDDQKMKIVAVARLGPEGYSWKDDLLDIPFTQQHRD